MSEKVYPKGVSQMIRPLWRAVVPEEVRRSFYRKRHGYKNASAVPMAEDVKPERTAVSGIEAKSASVRGPKLSVIMPVYKVEKYLDEAVKSVVDQTYKDMEIILVDDGSPDNCGAMCDAWAKKDKRIRVLHKVNGGLSDARNEGMKIASGTYIAFVDSDDRLPSRAYEILVGSLEESGSDVVTGNVTRFRGGRSW